MIRLFRNSSLAVLALTALAFAVPEEVLVLGSSVASGTGASPTSLGWAYRLEDLLENQAPVVPGSTVTWQVGNASVGGDTTTRVLNRFQADVVTAHPGSDIVIIGLSLANEGLVGAANPDAVFDSFKNGLAQIVGLCRTNGYYPVIGLVYPNSDYSANEYGYVKKMNVLLNTWDVPSINFLGALDDGQGHWAAGHITDNWHPNAAGHGEMFHTVVPSLFDAITAGKTTSPQIQGTNGYLRMQRDAAESSPVRFTPSRPPRSFTLSFRVRSTDVGTIAAVGSGASRATLEIRDSSLVYIGPTGAELVAPLDANDGRWHDVALSHRYGTGQSLLFVDGVLRGTASDQYLSDLFVINGAAGAAGRALAPLQADFQDVCIYRAAWTQDEAMAQSKGALQQASLEICAPLADAAPVQGAAFENRAQSMSPMTLHTASFSAQLASTVPDGLTAGAVTASTVNLTWTSNGGGGFLIERRRAGVAEPWITAGTSAANSPAFADSGLLPGTGYDYRVSAQDGTFQSDYSNVISVATNQTVPVGGLIWDADTATAGTQDGGGTWDAATTANWHNGTANQTWGNPTNPAKIAQFGVGGTSGTVTLSGTLNVGGITFSQGGYTLTAGTLSAVPGTGMPFVYSTNGGTSTLNSVFNYPTANTQIIKTGAGTLVLGNNGITTTHEGFYTVTGGAFDSQAGIFDSILSMVAGNRLGTGGAVNPTTPQVTLDAGTIRFTQTGNNNLANTRGLLVTAAGGALVDGGGNSFLPSRITNNAGASTSFYLSNVSGTTQFQGIISGPGSITWNGAGTASLQASNTYSGGTVIKAGGLHVTNDSGLGTGTLTFSGNATLQAGAAAINLANPVSLGGTSNVFDTNGNTFTLSGPVSNAAATNNAMKAAGTGTLVLSGSLNVTGSVADTNSPALMLGNRNGANFNRGTATITGTGAISRISTGWDGTANTLNFASSGTVTMAADLVSGQSANGVGVVNFTTGTLNLQNLNMANWDGSYGAFIMSGGTLNTTNLRNGGNGNGNGNSYSLMTGGVVNISTTGTIGRNGNGTNVLHLKGGNAQFNVGTGRLNVGFSGDSTGVVTVENGLLTVNSNLALAEGNTASTFGILNLNGGIVRPNTIVAGSAGGKSIVNFNGGTLQAGINHAGFLGGITAANIHTGGARIDSNGLNVTVSQSLQGASGSGVSSIPVTVAGAGYLGPPVVRITGGGGTGATAVATVSGGAVTGIQITSAGTGYTSAPAVSLIGGGFTTAATLGTIALAANAADGGLRKIGGGTLTLSGANTYAGATHVDAGSLAVNGSIASTAGVNVAAGAKLQGTGTVHGATSVSGTVAPGNSIGVLTLDAAIFAGGSTFTVEIDDSAAPKCDRLGVAGALDLTGAALVSVVTGTAGQSAYVIASYGTLVGTFASQTLPVGYAINYAYDNGVSSRNIALVKSGYSAWTTTKGLNGSNNGSGQDPDGDGVTNLMEFALGGNPLSGSDNGVSPVALRTVAGSQALTLTIAVRAGASGTTFAAGTMNSMEAAVEGVTYRIEGTADLSTWDRGIMEITPALADGLPDAPVGYEYHTFRTAGPVSTTVKDFIRAKVSEAP